MNTKAQEKIARAKTHILLASPWWATLLLNLRTVEADRVPTMGTDGTYLLYNPEFTLKLSDKECEGVLLHEVAHCALLHPFRRQWREPLRWNLAADAAANALLEADNIQLPKGCVKPAPLDKTAEEIYDSLPQDGKKMIQDVFGAGELGDCEQGETNGTAGDLSASAQKPAAQMSEQVWKDILASSRGLEPGNLSRTLDKSRDSVKDWKEALAEFMHAFKRSDSHTWTRISRRVPNSPGWKREPETSVAICIDTSGSISSVQLNAFMSECRAIASLTGTTIYLIAADADVHQVLQPGDSWPESLGGGGGTDFCPALRKAEELQPDAVVYFTDGDGSFPPECSLPVLWALTTHVPVPFGSAILIGEN